MTRLERLYDGAYTGAALVVLGTFLGDLANGGESWKWKLANSSAWHALLVIGLALFPFTRGWRNNPARWIYPAVGAVVIGTYAATFVWGAWWREANRLAWHALLLAGLGGCCLRPGWAKWAHVIATAGVLLTYGAEWACGGSSQANQWAWHLWLPWCWALYHVARRGSRNNGAKSVP